MPLTEGHVQYVKWAGKFITTENRLAVARGWGKGNREQLVISVGILFGVMKTSWNLIVMMFAQLWESTETHKLYIFKVWILPYVKCISKSCYKNKIYTIKTEFLKNWNKVKFLDSFNTFSFSFNIINNYSAFVYLTELRK